MFRIERSGGRFYLILNNSPEIPQPDRFKMFSILLSRIQMVYPDLQYGEIIPGHAVRINLPLSRMFQLVDLLKLELNP